MMKEFRGTEHFNSLKGRVASGKRSTDYVLVLAIIFPPRKYGKEFHSLGAEPHPPGF